MMKNYKLKIINLNDIIKLRKKFNKKNKKVVFTNGCFDIIHKGHVTYLEFAKQQGDLLILGLNSDQSVKRNKGDSRPINYVILFDEDEPIDVISAIVPDVLVKGEDWSHYVSGREIVEKNGGKVVLAKMVEGKSTSKIIEKIENDY